MKLFFVDQELWSQGEPNGDDAENCVVLRFDGKLADAPCDWINDDHAEYSVLLCERAGNSAPQPTSTKGEVKQLTR